MLRESPVFTAMKKAGAQSKNPIKEAFTYPGNRKRMLVAMIGIAAGFTVIAYTVMFQALYFLQNGLHVSPGIAQLLVGGSAFAGMAAFVYFGHLSDRVGRKKPIVIGYALVLLLLMPLYQFMGATANPALVEAGDYDAATDAELHDIKTGDRACREKAARKVNDLIVSRLAK